MTRSTIRALVLGLGLVGAALGCRPHVDVRWGPATAIPADDDRWPDAKAVIVLADTELIDISSHDTSYAEWRVHRIIRLRSPDALDLADLRITLGKNREIGDFKARSISPDGVVRSIDASALKSAAVKEDEEDVARVFVASIPGAEVGGVIEYTWSIESDYPLDWYSDDYRRLTAMPGLPIVQARMRITVNSIVRYSVRITNTRDKVRKVKDGSLRHLTWTSSDIGPPPDEKWAPTDDAWPRLLFKVKAYVFKSWRRSVSRTWGDILYWRARRLYGDPNTLYEDYEAPPLPDCPEGIMQTMCRVKAALAVAREEAAFDGLANSFFGQVEPLSRVLAEQAANQYEKVVLVGRLLRDAGLEVQYAFGVRPATGRVNPDYPDVWPLNHMLLYLPDQPGLAGPMWLDPGCEHCAPGELSDYSEGAQMFLIEYADAMLDRPEVKAKRVVARGKAATPDRVHNHLAVQLDADGAATVTLEETYEGMRAAWFAREIRRWSEDEAEKAPEDRLARIDRRARLLEAPAPTCDRAAGRCTRTLRFIVPGYATVDGDDLVVPLTLMHGSGRYSVPKRARRTREMVLPTNDAFHETLELTLPDGYTFAEGPKNFTAESDAFVTRLTLTAEPGRVQVDAVDSRRRGRYAPEGYGPRRAALSRSYDARQARIRLRRVR